MEFEWDEKKNKINAATHGFSFDMAPQFFSKGILKKLDTRKNYGEQRFIALGKIGDTVASTVYTIRKSNVYRIISMRRANRNERKTYHTLQERHEKLD